MTRPQRQLLTDIAATDYGEGYLRGSALRTGEALIRAGLLERTASMRWVKITRAGREALAEARPVPAGARETDPRPEGADKPEGDVT